MEHRQSITAARRYAPPVMRLMRCMMLSCSGSYLRSGGRSRIEAWNLRLILAGNLQKRGDGLLVVVDEMPDLIGDLSSSKSGSSSGSSTDASAKPRRRGAKRKNPQAQN
eukprot:scaffold31_cov263-Pinguiococcus_pyrenoidosus.AAC.9